MTGTEVLLVILEQLMTSDSQSFTDLKTAAGINQSTLSKHLSHLQEKGFVIKDGNGLYRTGEAFLKYRLRENSSHAYLPQINVLLHRLGTEWGATFLYLDFTQGRMDCLAKFVPENGVNMQYVGASRMNFLYNPWGVVFLASRKEQGTDPEKLRPLCRPAPAYQKRETPYDPEQVREFLGRLEETGFADEGDRPNSPVRRLAFPYSRGGKIIGAVGCGILRGGIGGIGGKDLEKMVGAIQNAIGEHHE